MSRVRTEGRAECEADRGKKNKGAAQESRTHLTHTLGHKRNAFHLTTMRSFDGHRAAN